MKDYRTEFIEWYFNEFQTTELYKDMQVTVEASGWHRERNVGAHTDMVVSHYMTSLSTDWTHKDLLGAFALTFHDVGKPGAEEIQYKKDTGEPYRRYTGHEVISARLWEDFISEKWADMSVRFDLVPEDIWKVAWTIEHHLPYGLKKTDKVKRLLHTATASLGLDTFFRVLRSDSWGRISDDHDKKKQDVEAWIASMVAIVEFEDTDVENHDEYAPTLTVLIGPSHCGKSTYIVNSDLIDTDIFSWDDLRLAWYDKNDYANAWKMSCEDKQFASKANAVFVGMVKTGKDVTVDNTNLSVKRRRFFVDEAKRKGYRTVAVMFPISKVNLVGRVGNRQNQSVPADVVIKHYMSVQSPYYGEFDEIIVTGGNLKGS